MLSRLGLLYTRNLMMESPAGLVRLELATSLDRAFRSAFFHSYSCRAEQANVCFRLSLAKTALLDPIQAGYEGAALLCGSKLSANLCGMQNRCSEHFYQLTCPGMVNPHPFQGGQSMYKNLLIRTHFDSPNLRESIRAAIRVDFGSKDMLTSPTPSEFESSNL